MKAQTAAEAQTPAVSDPLNTSAMRLVIRSGCVIRWGYRSLPAESKPHYCTVALYGPAAAAFRAAASSVSNGACPNSLFS